MAPNLTREMADIMWFAGAVITRIRAWTWSAQSGLRSDEHLAEIEKLADAAHNLHQLGMWVAEFSEKPAQSKSKILNECDFLIRGFERYLERPSTTVSEPSKLSHGARNLRVALQERAGEVDADDGSKAPLDRLDVEADVRNGIHFLKALATKVEEYEVMS